MKTHAECGTVYNLQDVGIFVQCTEFMSYTLKIDALCMESSINMGGVIDACFSLRRYAMEISFPASKNMWHFDTEAPPIDLIG